VFAVAVQCIEDNGIRFARGAYLIHLDGLAFEQLVVLEKPSQHNQAVRRHFRGLVVGVKLGILGGDGNDFVVRLAGVDHRHQPDGSPMNDGERHHAFLAEHEDIERIIIFCQRLRDETVVGGIINRRIEDAIQLNESARFVQFVLDARTEGSRRRSRIPVEASRRESRRAKDESSD
jgi:hypothetical protein